MRLDRETCHASIRRKTKEQADFGSSRTAEHATGRRVCSPVYQIAIKPILADQAASVSSRWKPAINDRSAFLVPCSISCPELRSLESMEAPGLEPLLQILAPRCRMTLEYLVRLVHAPNRSCLLAGVIRQGSDRSHPCRHHKGPHLGHKPSRFGSCGLAGGHTSNTLRSGSIANRAQTRRALAADGESPIHPAPSTDPLRQGSGEASSSLRARITLWSVDTVGREEGGATISVIACLGGERDVAQTGGGSIRVACHCTL